MTGQHLTHLLDDAAGRVPVGPPPLAGIVAGATRSRRRRRLGAVLGSAVVVVAAIGTTVALLPRDAGTSGRPAPPATVTAPAGMRFVGIGHAAIAVPDSWGTNDTECGTPTKETVVIGGGGTNACLLLRVPVVDSVEVIAGPPRIDFDAPQATTVDGVEVRRTRPVCPANAELCKATAYVPSELATFVAQSATAAGVDTILDRIRIVRDAVAVPVYLDLSNEKQEAAGSAYLQLLREAGLKPEVETEKQPGMLPGFLLGVSPEPGTMLEPGSTVVVRQTAPPDGPADEVEVHLSAADPTNEQSGMTTLDNARIATDPTIHVQRDKEVWAYAFGKYSKTFKVAVTGDALERRGSPGDTNYPNTWTTRPGRSTLTLTIEAGGETIRLGAVTIVVD